MATVWTFIREFFQELERAREPARDTEQRALLGLEGKECQWSKSILTQAPVALEVQPLS